ncbi:hypothetical protein BT93_K0786 [Corymbia citriodora subsp. variegata]|nr:hypothetical protein BT93_K0786 [Corymbia citriodora subsp. variegata]
MGDYPDMVMQSQSVPANSVGVPSPNDGQTDRWMGQKPYSWQIALQGDGDSTRAGHQQWPGHRRSCPGLVITEGRSPVKKITRITACHTHRRWRSNSIRASLLTTSSIIRQLLDKTTGTTHGSQGCTCTWVKSRKRARGNYAAQHDMTPLRR